jgi:hypothetical protein
VREWSTPKNKHEIRSFLGINTYYRRFISGFANAAKPLTKLTAQKQSFQWTPEVEAAFQMLKAALCAAAILACPHQERGSSWTQTPVTSGFEECYPKYGTDRSEL